MWAAAVLRMLGLIGRASPKAPYADDGALAQLVERLPYTQNVGGSSPSRPTKDSRTNKGEHPFAFVASRVFIPCLNFVRNNKRITQGFLALITLPFAFWGVDSYVRNADVDAELATVGSSRISQQELQAALREQQDRMRAQLGGKYDPAMFDTPQMRRAVLDSLVTQRLLAAAGADSQTGHRQRTAGAVHRRSSLVAGERQVFQRALRGAGCGTGHEQGNVRGAICGRTWRCSN